MIRKISIFVTGLLLGVVVAGAAGWKLMPGLMLTVHESKLGFDETVAALDEAALARGWKVPKIYDIQKSLVEAGHTDVARIKILSICQPSHAHRILQDDRNKKVTAIMPCRIGVYETSDGKVQIAEMNIGLMSKMFGGTIEEVMGEVAREEAQMLAAVLK